MQVQGQQFVLRLAEFIDSLTGLMDTFLEWVYQAHRMVPDRRMN